VHRQAHLFARSEGEQPNFKERQVLRVGTVTDRDVTGRRKIRDRPSGHG